MKTKIIKVKGDWVEVVNDARFTMGKKPMDKEPSAEFRRNILIAEHSPIRDISFKWAWYGVKEWVTGHWARHKWEKFIRTQRSDRTGIPRDELPQKEPKDFTGEANVQALIDTMRKRLCFKASPETREYAEDLKMSIAKVDKDVGRVLVPNCVYRGFCPEMEGCGLWRNFEKKLTKTQITSWFDRYQCYNNWLKETMEKRGDLD